MPPESPLPASPPGGFYPRRGKRACDLVAATLALVASLPVLVVAGLLVKLTSPGPVFFRQNRLGFAGRIFPILKLRTMTDRPRTRHQEVRPGNPEVTRAGKWLRRTKIDELPQLLNVLAGHMSLVGPRPGLPEQLPDYTPLARVRLLVRPGLTGLAQIHGNIHLTWEQRWHYDADYVRRLGPSLDLWIVWRTLLVVASGEARFARPPTPPPTPPSWTTNSWP